LAFTYRSGNATASFSLSRLQSGDKILNHLQTLHSRGREGAIIPNEPKSADLEGSLPSVPPDALLKNMEIVVSKTIRNVSIKSLYEKVWADNSPDKESFYGSWLKDEDCFEISTGDWEYADSGAFFTNPWCKEYGESYTQRRLVTFKFKRTTHLYIGPPIAFVKQEHYIRVEGNDKCVLAIEATFEGIPYSDTFGVEMRWVARRVGANDVQVDVGLFVLFKKSTMLKSQIKSGTISETKNVHLRLFNAVKKACTAAGEAPVEEVEEVEEEEEEVGIPEKGFLLTLKEKISGVPSFGSTAVYTTGLMAALFFGRYFLKASMGAAGQADIQRLETQISDLQQEIRTLQKSVEQVVDLLKNQRN